MLKRVLGISLRKATVGVACVLAVASAGAAQASSKVGWVWANQPSATSSYTPSTGYSYNSAGGTITITPLGTGDYEVYFGKLFTGTPDGDVQVTAYQTSGYCTSGGWGYVTKGHQVAANVRCFDANGNPANSYFTLVYQLQSGNAGNASKGMAYVWAYAPTTASYTLSGSYEYNSTGASNSIVRNSTGYYTVTVPGLTNAGDVQVTAYGGGAARCKVYDWGSNSGATFINVLCFNSSGQAADEEFDLVYSDKDSFGHTPSATARGVYAWADQPTRKHPYKPDVYYQYNGFGTGRLSAVKNSTGFDTVSIPGSLSYGTSNVLVTGYDSTSNYCNVYNWGSATVNVVCYAQGGALVDSDFDVGFQTAD